MAFVTSTDLWTDAEGIVLECCKPVSFFRVSDAETGNVTIDGIRASGIDAYRVVYAAGMDDYTEDYCPTVRLCVSGSDWATVRRCVGVTAHPAQIDDKIAVYTSGIVKVKMASPTGMESHTVTVGRYLTAASDGYVKSAPDPTAATSYIDYDIGRAVQSAASGDEFLMLLRI